MRPTLPNEVNGAIKHLMRRDVKNTRDSRLRRLINLQKKQDVAIEALSEEEIKKQLAALDE